jgi:hypothetical protein
MVYEGLNYELNDNYTAIVTGRSDDSLKNIVIPDTIIVEG